MLPGFEFLDTIASVVGALMGLHAMEHAIFNTENALIILLIGVALIAAEAIITAKGVLALIGIITSFIGIKILVDLHLPSFEAAPQLFMFVYGALIFFTLSALVFVLHLSRVKQTTGVEELLQAQGSVQSWAHNKGVVHVTGENWQAVSENSTILKKGDIVRIVKIDGLILTVAPV